MTQKVLTKLRHKQTVKIFEKSTKLIHHIQFNKKDIDNIIKNINKNK